ncbi:membrane protein implicated in regulation of membrane protease activity [Bradyrhizobium sp. F1.4.3]|uniref:hypothetical protein n=1 Tax=Bradyrhizobium sp. F1.4.3 TaxID=3156356 RepID=UPI003394752D
MTQRRKRRAGPTATELRLKAIHEGDKSLAIMLAPIFTAIINLIALAWVLAMMVAVPRGAEAVPLLLIAFFPIVLLWFLARGLRRMANGYRREREGKAQ